MADLTQIQASQSVKIAGGDEQFIADVSNLSGQKRLLVESVGNALFGSFKIADPNHLIGFVMEGSTLDLQNWTKTEANGGTVTVSNAVATLSTNTTANGSVLVSSKEKAVFLTGTNNAFISGIRLGNTGVANNIRRWGAFDSNNGLFYELNGTTFRIIRRHAGTDNVITSFNGATPVIDTDFHVYEIVYSQGKAFFIQDAILIHTETALLTALCGTPHHNLSFENVNSGGSATQAQLFVRGSAISRLGVMFGKQTFFHLSANGTTTLKVGPGSLHSIVINSRGLGNNTVTFYDSLTGSGDIIAIVESVFTIGTLLYDFDFKNGLTVVSTGGQSSDATIVYD